MLKNAVGVTDDIYFDYTEADLVNYVKACPNLSTWGIGYGVGHVNAPLSAILLYDKTQISTYE